MRMGIAIAASCLAWAAPAAAEEKLLDLSKPEVVAQATRDAGYKAELKTNSKGEPFISSSTNGSDFSIEFYGCKGKSDCGSFQFYSWYKKEPLYTLELANEWNAKKRFMKIAIDGEGDLSQFMDWSAVGPVSQKNFADMLDWYTVMDSELSKFLKDKRDNGAKD